MSTENIGNELLTFLNSVNQEKGSSEQKKKIRIKKTIATLFFLTSHFLCYLWGNASSLEESRPFAHWDNSPIKGFVLVKVPVQTFFPYSKEKLAIPISLFTQQNELLVAKAYFHPQQHFQDDTFALSLHPKDMNFILEGRYWPLKALPYTRYEKEF